MQCDQVPCTKTHTHAHAFTNESLCACVSHVAGAVLPLHLKDYSVSGGGALSLVGQVSSCGAAADRVSTHSNYSLTQ